MIHENVNKSSLKPIYFADLWEMTQDIVELLKFVQLISEEGLNGFFTLDITRTLPWLEVGVFGPNTPRIDNSLK